jgi:hypothetical protein
MTRKVFSVLFLVLAAICLVGAVVAQGQVLLGRAPERGVGIFMLLAGAASVWAAARLWERWRLPFGIIWIAFAVSTFGNIAVYRSLATTTSGHEAELYDRLAGLFPIAGVLLLVFGIVLIVWDKRRGSASSR